MSLFRFLWLKRFIRRNTTPIPENRAVIWKNRLSIAYMLISWNAFGLVCYMFYKGKGDWAKYYGLKSEEELAMTPAQRWSKTLGIRDAEVYTVKGFNVTKYEIHNSEEELKRK